MFWSIQNLLVRYSHLLQYRIYTGLETVYFGNIYLCIKHISLKDFFLSRTPHHALAEKIRVGLNATGERLLSLDGIGVRPFRLAFHFTASTEREAQLRQCTTTLQVKLPHPSLMNFCARSVPASPSRCMTTARGNTGSVHFVRLT